MMQFLALRTVTRAYLLSIACWWGIALLMGLQYKPPDPQHFWLSFGTLLVEAGIRGFASALWTPPIFYLAGKSLGRSSRRIRYMPLWVLGAVPFVLSYTAIVLTLIRPYDDVAQKYVPRSLHLWLEMIRGGFADLIFAYIAIVVAAHGYEYLKRLRTEERERYEYQQALAASELQALKMQLHPHFLFNTLHGIATLVDNDPKTAKAMIIKVSSLLRKSLERENTDLIALREELGFVSEYLDLEKMRFGTRLKVEWFVAPETLELLVPQMLLQPLVENAVRHGIACSREGGWISIASTQGEGLLDIQVRNSTGSQRRTGTGLGLRNAEARLKYLYSGDANLSFTVAEDHTATARLRLPSFKMRHASMTEQPSTSSLGGKDATCEFSSSTMSR